MSGYHKPTETDEALGSLMTAVDAALRVGASDEAIFAHVRAAIRDRERILIAQSGITNA